ncbi:MAG: gamma-glutamyl-gamma-aminobutyrate hydrolase family protein [Bdellovibrionales bacterium]|nr:gamma-glutamyl-gamma-aminobutyrate hydrolase family protein [Bdellovibrionales bacterium]
MKTILATQRLIENSTYHEVRDALDIKWGEFFRELGAQLVPLPLNSDLDSYMNSLKVDGVLLTSGNDLSTFSNSHLSQLRDTFETEVVKHCFSNGTPLLGVCRGLQLLANFFGGTLKEVEGHVAAPHSIKVESSPRLLGSLPIEMLVNSYHNYALVDPGPEIVPIAKAADGTIEAFEHCSKPIAAIMWHPERTMPFANHDKQLFETFFSLS